MIYHVVIVIIPVEHGVEVVHRFCAGMILHLCTKDWRVLSHLGSVINKVVIVWYLLQYICQFFCIESSVYYRRHARLLIYGSPSLLDYNYLNLKKKQLTEYADIELNQGRIHVKGLNVWVALHSLWNGALQVHWPP